MTHVTRTPSERSFGVSVGLVCVALAAIRLRHGSDGPAIVLLTVGVALIVFGLALPRALRVPNRIWMRIAHTLGWINARVILSLFFAFVLTPAGLLMRFLGRNVLAPAGETSNWVAHESRKRDEKHYERPY